ncbi:MAG: SGNH/GDSL hydrolase family protein [Candidatus Omnitrophota bacterium]
MQIWFPLMILVLLVFFLTFILKYYFVYFWQKKTKLRSLAIKFSLCVLSLLYLFIILEIIFAAFFIQSDSYTFTTLASQRWFQKYWNPINSAGYRDYEYNWDGEKIIFILGDSFAAGHGIKNISHRFSGVLKDKLGPEWIVVTLAKNGWDTVNEYLTLVQHPKKPKKIIVSYYINDIESIARKKGYNIPWELLVKHPPISFAGLIIRTSFIVNWMYWNLHRGQLGEIYWDYLKHLFNNPQIWELHKQELLKFIIYAQEINAEILFIVWPYLGNIPESLEFTSKVVDFLEKQNVKVLDLGKYYLNYDPENLIVNKLDTHPNEKVHAQVAELLYKELFLTK